MNNELQVIDLSNIESALMKVTAKHKKISKLKTPTTEVEQKGKYDYVNAKYMRKIANEEYPGWSWVILKYEMVGSSWMIVHGRLTWFEAGMIRVGDMLASHRIQTSEDDDGKDYVVDLSNDIKAANTDCLKKAFNLYMNISDDIYRWEVKELATPEQVQELRDLYIKTGDERKAGLVRKVMTEEDYLIKKKQLEKLL